MLVILLIFPAILKLSVVLALLLLSVLVLLVLGLIMMALGYQKKLLTNMETKTVVEYRFIPRSIYEDQFENNKLESSFQDMFEKQDVFFRMI